MSISKMFSFSDIEDDSKRISQKEEQPPALTEQEVFDILSDNAYQDLNPAFRVEALKIAKRILRDAKSDLIDFRVRYNSSPNLQLELKDDYYEKRDRYEIWDNLMRKVNRNNDF